MQNAVGMQYTVGTQYTVGISAKRSTHTVNLSNMVVGTVTFSAIRSNPHSGVCSRYAVHSSYTVRNRYAVCSRYAVRSRYAVHSKC